MNESILNTVKKGLGINESYKVFDADLIVHINTVFMILNQIGVGPAEPFTIEDDQDFWEDFITNESLEAIKSYVTMRVRQLFDPPTNGSVAQSVKENVAELEWRLNVAVDPEDTFTCNDDVCEIK